VQPLPRLSVCLLTLLCWSAQAVELQGPIAVVADDSGQYWCSILGPLSENERDGNGLLVQVDAQGVPVGDRQLPGPGDPPLNAPRGMAVLGNLLWVIDIDRAVAYDLRRMLQVAVIPLKEHGLLQGIDCCAIGDDLLISDPVARQLLLLRGARTGSIRAIEVVERGGMGVPMAIAYSAARAQVLVAESATEDQHKGGVFTYSWDDQLGKCAQVPLGDGSWTGVVRLDDGTIYASSLKGSLWSLPMGQAPVCITEDLQMPGDFCLSVDGNSALVPERDLNRIRVVPLHP
jgi:hypothetical protein